MSRLIDPPRQDFERLPTPLTVGERQLIDLFDRYLDADWEMYVQPHLNGLRPDLVLLKPTIGIAVFEIKDWDLSAMHYFVSGSDLWAKKDGNRFRKKNPINKIRQYRDEIFNLYCPRLNAKAGKAVITAGLIFTKMRRQCVFELLDTFRDEPMQKYPRYYPITGSDDLGGIGQSALDRIFPEWNRRSSACMTPELADDLRGWLRDPAFNREQRQRPIPLNDRQRDLVKTRTRSGYRRIRGAAGSGKSVVLACRAAELAVTGRSVLVVCFNITLLNYLQDLAVRHDFVPSKIRRNVIFLNFHEWCRRICRLSAYEEYKEIWRHHFESFPDAKNDPKPALQKVVELVDRLYRERKPPGLCTYDAILVDEGQDFSPDWWHVLRQALKPDGEMVLVADKTQDIYGTAGRWTDDAMRGCGFTGMWSELHGSYRLPKPVIPFVTRFAEDFLRGEMDLPIAVQIELEIDECGLRWIHVEHGESEANVCFIELERIMRTLPQNTAMADLTFISSSEKIGHQVVKMLQNKNVQVAHTFNEDLGASRRQKRAFFQGDARVKATTIHSYKGWEGKLLVVFIGSIECPEDKAMLYTAMTRLRKDQQQCALTVVSTCNELKAFGKSWPCYREHPA